MDRLSANEFRRKLQTIKEDRGYVSKLRTQLRQMIAKELQSGPTALSYLTPVMTMRGRAMGSLVVEWLRIQECHFTLSVLASEVPSLSDLPGLCGEGPKSAIKKEEAEGILSALCIQSDEIMKEYEQSSESLLACIIKVIGLWKGRLDFRKSPESPRSQNRWSNRLREVVANSCLNPSQMSTVYYALHNVIKSEIEEGLAEERRAMIQRQAESERKVKEELTQHEQLLLTRLQEAEQGLSESKDLANQEIAQQRTDLSKLLQDISKQHKIVADGISQLSNMETRFERSKKAWQSEMELERKRQSEAAEDLAKKIKQFEDEKSKYSAARRPNSHETENKSTDTSDLPKGSNQQPAQNERSPTKSAKHMRKFLVKSNRAVSSSDESSNNNGAAAIAWQRLKDLRDEASRKNKEVLQDLRSALDSDSDDSQENPTYLRRSSSSPQVVLPTLHEGCQYEVMAAERRAATLAKYSHLLSTGDGVRPANRSRIPEVISTTRKDVRRRLRHEANRLNNLFVAVREVSTPDMTKVRTVKDIRKREEDSKLERLANSIRSPKEDSSDNASAGNISKNMNIEIQVEANENINQRNLSSASDAPLKSRIPVSAGMSPRPEKRTTDLLTALHRVESPRRTLTPCSRPHTSRSDQDRSSVDVKKVSQLPVREVNSTPDQSMKTTPIPISPVKSEVIVGETKNQASHRNPTAPSLLQATLLSDSELSEGEDLSIGGTNISGRDFWS